MIWLLVFLLILALTPHLAGQIQYALTAADQRAKAEVAQELLAKIPEQAGLWPWVAKAVEPCVVGIKTIGNRQTPVLVDEWAHPRVVPRPQWQVEGEGSGVIVDKSGYIVTNFHVVRNAAEVVVRLPNGQMVDAVEVVGVDPLSDVAVLKIDNGDLTAAPWGNSDELEVGEPVLAVGSPFGLEGSVTSGILSAKGRQGIVPGVINQEFLQTDAAVNPGNSGGPLVNRRGQVVGINTAIHGESYQGISFAIPSNVVRDVFEQLKSGGKVVRGWLGVEIRDLDEALAKKLGLAASQGALVVSAVPGSPAEKAGVRPGDVLIQWNDAPIREASELSRAAASAEIGARAKLLLLRDGQQRELSVTITERPTQM